MKTITTESEVDWTIASWHTITVCGMKGTGKTTLEKLMLTKYQRILVFDVNGEFTEFPRYLPETDSPKELDKVAKAVWNEGNCLLMVSEAELYLPVNGTLPPNVFKITTRGRHRNIGMIADTRRIANLNKTVFGLSEHVFAFRHFAPTDIKYLNEFFTKDAREMVHLKDYWYWQYHRGVVKVCPPITPPKLPPIVVDENEKSPKMQKPQKETKKKK